ncbi:hypothetical protein N7451_011353 [Penicillium sp. IBT 35674x]|nr:hypothetical protein N7451_011353 [Penicillium sp. IBT 35674x]
MGFKMENNLPSDKELEEADQRASAKEAEIRRPSREKEILQEAAEDETFREQRSKAAKDLLAKWGKIHCEESRRRHASVLYEISTFLQESWELGDEDEGKLPTNALVAVSKSITRVIAMYCQLFLSKAPSSGKLSKRENRSTAEYTNQRTRDI